MSSKDFYQKQDTAGGVRGRLRMGGDDAPATESSSTTRGVNVGASTSATSVGTSATSVGGAIGDFKSGLLGRNRNLTPRKINLELLRLEEEEEGDISSDDSASEYAPSAAESKETESKSDTEGFDASGGGEVQSTRKLRMFHFARGSSQAEWELGEMGFLKEKERRAEADDSKTPPPCPRSSLYEHYECLLSC